MVGAAITPPACLPRTEPAPAPHFHTLPRVHLCRVSRRRLSTVGLHGSLFGLFSLWSTAIPCKHYASSSGLRGFAPPPAHRRSPRVLSPALWGTHVEASQAKGPAPKAEALHFRRLRRKLFAELREQYLEGYRNPKGGVAEAEERAAAGLFHFRKRASGSPIWLFCYEKGQISRKTGTQLVVRAGILPIIRGPPVSVFAGAPVSHAPVVRMSLA
jgi:hypothetical protein